MRQREQIGNADINVDLTYSVSTTAAQQFGRVVLKSDLPATLICQNFVNVCLYFCYLSHSEGENVSETSTNFLIVSSRLDTFLNIVCC